MTQGQAVLTLKNDALTNAAVNAGLSVETARTNLEQLEAKRSDYTIAAPIDGTLIHRSAASRGLCLHRGAMATLAPAHALCVNAEIDEIYIDRIWPGRRPACSLPTTAEWSGPTPLRCAGWTKTALRPAV